MSQPRRRSKRFKTDSPAEAAGGSNPTDGVVQAVPAQGTAECKVEVAMLKTGECSSCKESVNDPVSCTKCRKFFCWKCFDVWLSFTPRTMCPVCVGESKKTYDSCVEHDQELNLFCLTCWTRICSGCFLNGTDHKRHQIDDLDVVYREKLADINSKLKEAGELVAEFLDVIDRTKFNEELICKNEDRIYFELGQLMQTAKAETIKWKNEKLSFCKMRKEAPLTKKRLFNELQSKIEGMAKHELIAKKQELELQIADLIPNANALCLPAIDCHDYNSLLIPQCRKVPIVLENFSRHLGDLKYDLISSVDVSDSSQTLWTVRVFKGKHLTVEFSQKHSLKHRLSFQLFVEIVHSDLRKTLRTQCSNLHIELIEIDKLKEQGFISESDEVTISIWIRPIDIIVEREALTLNLLDVKRQKNELVDKSNRDVAKLRDSEQFAAGYLRIPLEKLQFPEQGTMHKLQIKSHVIKDFDGRSWCLYVERIKANRNCVESYIGAFLKLCSPLKKKKKTTKRTPKLRRRYYVELVNNDCDYSIRKYSTDGFNLRSRFGWSPFVRMSRVFADNSGFVRKGAIGFRFGVQNKKLK